MHVMQMQMPVQMYTSRLAEEEEIRDSLKLVEEYLPQESKYINFRVSSKLITFNVVAITECLS